jgi:hypothetical protein
MNIAMKAICWQNAARDFNFIQDVYRRQKSLLMAAMAQREAAKSSANAMKCLLDLLHRPRGFNAETIAECERIQQEIDQADYDLSQQHRGFGSPA